MSAPATLAPRTGRRAPSRFAPLPERTDDDLLLDVRAGDLRAYEELYRRHQAEAGRYARSLVPRDLADDLVAEAFAKMLGALRRGKGPTSAPIRYLMVALRTTAVTLRHRHHRHHQVVQRPEVVAAIDHELPLMSDDDLVLAFRSLSARWRQVIFWSEFDELSPVEIGERLGLSPAAASALTYRARRGLREAYLANLAGGVVD
ncbi:sigma-70 family RNA polymerase sigma factor [Aquihabitans sp. G128]|uniref:RNA polymerase sigma factor n=1 Tax=Aquihabitans sp. G128 TaxID=2849779 RepID=UPI001C21F137|nr:sigma-70 family RNA polymerase sigma factor [Aquihabitans sp. G128]QXC60132.1 sigma-70 family RNA polymerase sigma factor [Aquihabitans sp. G128]